MEQKKSTRGGKRPGAGRKRAKPGEECGAMTLWLPKRLRSRLQAARLRGIDLGELIDGALDAVEETDAEA